MGHHGTSEGYVHIGTPTQEIKSAEAINIQDIFIIFLEIKNIYLQIKSKKFA